jgi:hypothetical protein
LLKSLIERPALLVSELGILLLGVVLTIIGFNNFAGAFAADHLAFLGAFIFLVAGVWCLSVSLVVLLGHPRSAIRKATFVTVGWLGATYPLSGAFTYLGTGTSIAARLIAMAGIALALFSSRGEARTDAKAA